MTGSIEKLNCSPVAGKTALEACSVSKEGAEPAEALCPNCQMPGLAGCSGSPGVPMVDGRSCRQFDDYFRRVRFSGRWPVPARYSEASFADRPATQSAAILAELDRAYLEAEAALSASYNGVMGNIVIHGGRNGAGKTRLAAAIINRAGAHLSMHTAWSGAQDLVRRITESYDDDNDEAPKDILRDLERADLLCIDDVGKQRSNEHADELMWTVFNRRYNAGKPSIITTNLSSAELARNDIWAGIFDRLIETATVIKLGERSIRQNAYAERSRRDHQGEPCDPDDRMEGAR